jgi:hypothetical protein
MMDGVTKMFETVRLPKFSLKADALGKGSVKSDESAGIVRRFVSNNLVHSMAALPPFAPS